MLQASDFTQGTAKYVTQEIDRTVEERHVTSGETAATLNFNATDAGIYVLEVTAADRQGRQQTLHIDSSWPAIRRSPGRARPAKP